MSISPKRSLKGEEAEGAGVAAAKGAALGAARWGVGMAVLGAVGYFMSPVYRSFTIQFKTYIQMSGMIVGGMIEADASLRRYEAEMRLRRRAIRNQAAWAAYEREMEEESAAVAGRGSEKTQPSEEKRS